MLDLTGNACLRPLIIRIGCQVENMDHTINAVVAVAVVVVIFGVAVEGNEALTPGLSLHHSRECIRRCWGRLHMADIVDGNAVERIGVAVRTTERGGCISRCLEPRLKGTTIV